jgi:hypothetical protein
MTLRKTVLAEHGIASVTVRGVAKIIGDQQLARDPEFMGYLIDKFAHRPRSVRHMTFEAWLKRRARLRRRK